MNSTILVFHYGWIFFWGCFFQSYIIRYEIGFLVTLPSIYWTLYHILLRYLHPQARFFFFWLTCAEYDGRCDCMHSIDFTLRWKYMIRFYLGLVWLIFIDFCWLFCGISNVVGERIEARSNFWSTITIRGLSTVCFVVNLQLSKDCTAPKLVLICLTRIIR